MKHFCAAEAGRAPEAGHSDRPTMIQPNCYWILETPVVTIVGLYSNVSGELDDADSETRTQRDWLTEELSPGFLRVTITHDELTGEYFTLPKPGREKKPAKLRDEFTLDLRTHRLV
jgi:hypothetical protein